MNYIKAHVRLEGLVNRYWTLTKEDGTTESYYSVEGSPQRDGDDERVYNYDPQLADFLEALSDPIVLPARIKWDEDKETIEYDVEVVTFLEEDQVSSLSNIVVNP